MVREIRTSPGPAQGGDPGPDMHRDAPDLPGRPAFHLPGVQAGSNLQAERAHPVADHLGAADCAGRAVRRD